MARFTSTRERRFWAWALAVLIAIYASAVFAGSLVNLIRSQTLLGIAFAAGLAVGAVAVMGLALWGRPRAEIWVAAGVIAVYGMIPVRSGLTAVERTHLFEYGLLSAVLYEALTERKENGAGVRLPGFLAILAATSFGWLDEALQALVPTRVYDVRDVGINAIAAIITVATVAAVRRGKERTAQATARSASNTQAGSADDSS